MNLLFVVTADNVMFSLMLVVVFFARGFLAFFVSLIGDEVDLFSVGFVLKYGDVFVVLFADDFCRGRFFGVMKFNSSLSSVDGRLLQIRSMDFFVFGATMTSRSTSSSRF